MAEFAAPGGKVSEDDKRVARIKGDSMCGTGLITETTRQICTARTNR